MLEILLEIENLEIENLEIESLVDQSLGHLVQLILMG